MVKHLANQIIRLLFGVQGDDRIDVNGTSGYLIKKSIDGIVAKIQGTDGVGIKFKADPNSLQTLKTSIENSIQTVNIAKATVSSFELSSGAADSLRTKVEDALKNLNITIGNVSGGTADGSGTSGSTGGKSGSSTVGKSGGSKKDNDLVTTIKLWKELNRARIDAAKAPAGSPEHLRHLENIKKKTKEAVEAYRQLKQSGADMAKLNGILKSENATTNFALGIIGDRSEYSKYREEVDRIVRIYREFADLKNQAGAKKAGSKEEIELLNQASKKLEEVRTRIRALKQESVNLFGKPEDADRLLALFDGQRRLRETFSASKGASDIKASRESDKNTAASNAKEIKSIIALYKELYSAKLEAQKAPMGSREQEQWLNKVKTLAIDAALRVKQLRLASGANSDEVSAVKSGINSEYESFRKQQIEVVINLYKDLYHAKLEAQKAPSNSRESEKWLEKVRTLAIKAADGVKQIKAAFGTNSAEVSALMAGIYSEYETFKFQSGLQDSKTEDKNDRASDGARAKELEKLIGLNRELRELEVEIKNLEAQGKPADASWEAYNQKVKERYELMQALGLTAEELQRIEAKNQEELDKSTKAIERNTRSIENRKAAKEAEYNKPIESNLPIQQMQAELSQFQTLLGNVSKAGYLDPAMLQAFEDRFTTIRNNFNHTLATSEKLDNGIINISQGSMIDFLRTVQDLTKELLNAHHAAGSINTAFIKDRNSFEKLANRASDYLKRIRTPLSRDPEMMKQLEHFIERLHTGEGFKGITDASAQFQQLQYQIKQAGLETETFMQRIKTVLKNKFGYGIAGTAMLYVRRQLQAVYQNVVEIDAKLTDLQIVSGKTGSEMIHMFNETAEAAKRVAASITDIIDATTVYNRLGFDPTTSLKFAELTTMYSKVGDVDISEAEDNLTAIIKAFDFNTAEELSLAMDQMVETANKFASDAKGLGSGLQDAASALTAAGNSYEESLALLTAANTVTQDASKSSTALRTIAARLRQSSTELEELGEDPLDSEYDTTSKYRAKLKALSGVDILEADQKTYKSTIQILRELAAVWDEISDIDKSSIVYMAAGKILCPYVQKCA